MIIDPRAIIVVISCFIVLLSTYCIIFYCVNRQLERRNRIVLAIDNVISRSQQQQPYLPLSNPSQLSDITIPINQEDIELSDDYISLSLPYLSGTINV
jgi:hypothetical protein